jgi:hypothetical protein
MIEITFAFAIVIEAVWLVVQTRAHRQEVRNLQRRLNALGTELGILKVRSHKPEKYTAIPKALPAVHMADSAALRIAIAAADFRLPDHYCSQRPAFEGFSPSWI